MARKLSGFAAQNVAAHELYARMHALPNGTSSMVKKRMVTAREALSYAMSVPGVAVTVSGVDSMRVLRQNLAIARGFRPLGARAMARLRARVAEEASDGRFELYKVTAKHEGAEGRKQHGFPDEEEAA